MSLHFADMKSAKSLKKLFLPICPKWPWLCWQLFKSICACEMIPFTPSPVPDVKSLLLIELCAFVYSFTYLFTENDL